MGVHGIAVVVEDDGDNRALLRALLQRSGFSVHTASSGAEGVQAARLHDPTVVLLYRWLPEFDGIEAAGQIRRFSDAFIVFVSGSMDEEAVLRAYDAGADVCLTKPFRPRELSARIAAILRRPRTLIR